ncbi:hypothetical protein CRE_11832 [Caenorhabditis remanei]|uniref:Uncharacterized protein n=1 Tax=Caenorhabditis remanei TaxID=31234 RepID=E3M4Y2_CAERE|nr:hypothetical protein CRE_11832 [Caenorhabditis remanei]
MSQKLLAVFLFLTLFIAVSTQVQCYYESTRRITAIRTIKLTAMDVRTTHAPALVAMKTAMDTEHVVAEETSVILDTQQPQSLRLFSQFSPFFIYKPKLTKNQSIISIHMDVELCRFARNQLAPLMTTTSVRVVARRITVILREHHFIRWF